MRHQGVESEITVAESAVPFHASAGWEVVEETGAAEGEQAADDSESGGAKPSSGRPRAGSAKNKEQD